ncbi:MAG: ABC transporter ATP-binding protein [Candidatus Sumerlaeota bacterium]|nr:ABC transporter ATP-binding protein [Candidatus Sumerlaeota bacterium]
MGDQEVHALDGVSFSAIKGEMTAIIGASGSGKSTLMNIIGCLDRPTSGRYMLDGEDVSVFSDNQLARIRNKRIGFVFQNFNLLPRNTALENVEMPLLYSASHNARHRAMEAMERVNLRDRAHHEPNQLSGGQRQRVAIARALVTNPTIVLADEPTGNLDSRTGNEIMQLFHDLNEQGVTLIIVTHEPDIAAHCRRIIIMRDGQIIDDKDTSDAAASKKSPRNDT